ncbi:ABC transporter substrate-binding protein [Gordonia malaquae]|uniref:ABC transporter substrate-binding protein n=1 Tax=Gordonia TaxID=2053 RepID=UPI0030175364
MSVVAVAAAMSAVLAGCSSGASDVGGDRTVSVQGTDYTIPSDPQRIVSIFNAATQALIEAGGADRIVAAQDLSLNLVPAANRAAYKAIPAKIDMDGSAESQASYNPDLFVSVDFVEPGLNDELAKFAPVAIMQVSGKGRPDWKGRSKAAGEILGTSDKITELETTLAARQADIKSRFADVLGSKTVTVLDSYERGNLYAYGTKSMVGSLFGDAGVRFAPSVAGDGTTPDTNPGEFESSAEKLGDFLDADIVLVVSDYDRKYDELQTALVNNPLLANSGKPVQSLGMGQISSYAQANFLLDSLEKALTAARAQK